MGATVAWRPGLLKPIPETVSTGGSSSGGGNKERLQGAWGRISALTRLPESPDPQQPAQTNSGLVNPTVFTLGLAKIHRVEKRRVVNQPQRAAEPDLRHQQHHQVRH